MPHVTAAIVTLNVKPVPVAEVPVVSLHEFRETLQQQVLDGIVRLLGRIESTIG